LPLPMGRSGPPSNMWFLGTTWVVNPNGISIGNNRPHLHTRSIAMWPNNNSLCLWCCHHGRAIARVHLVHLMNAEFVPNGPLSLRQSQRVCAVSLPVGCYYYYSHLLSPFIFVTHPKSWCSFAISQRMEGSKGMQTIPITVYVHVYVYGSGCHDKHNWDLKQACCSPAETVSGCTPEWAPVWWSEDGGCAVWPGHDSCTPWPGLVSRRY